MHKLMKVAAIAAGGLVTLAGCQSAPAEPAPVAAEAPLESPAEVEEAEQAEAQELRFALSEELDDRACTYEGPASVPAGVQTFTFDNGHSERTLEVIMTRIKEGFDYDDVLTWLGDDRPHEVEQRVLTPDWLDGDWRPIRPVEPATEVSADVNVLAGEYALFCLLQGPPGNGHVWPATALSVAE